MPEIVELLKCRRKVDQLPLTAKMIAQKWSPPELEEIMVSHLSNKNVMRADLGLPEEGDDKPSLEPIVEQTSFTAISCLQYYPSERNRDLI